MTPSETSADRSPIRRLTPRPFRRRPVSATRERIGWGVLALLALGAVIFRWTTSDEQIRRRAIQFLRVATHGDVSVASARFSMFGGITLTGVRISTPFDPELDPRATSEADREIFSAATLTLVPNPWRLLTFSLDVREIVATDPHFTLAQNLDTGAYNWQSLASTEAIQRPRRLPNRPRVRLRDAEVRLESIDAGGRRMEQKIRLDVDASPQPASTTAYWVDVRQYGDQPNRGRVVYDPLAGAISDMPTIGLRTVRGLLPRLYQEFFDQLGLAGDIRSDQIQYRADAATERVYRLELKAVKFRVPLTILGSAGASGGRSATAGTEVVAAWFDDINGRIELVGNDVSFDLSGRLNNAPCRVKGAVRSIDRPLDHVGLDIEIRTDGLEMPEGAARESLETSDSVPEGLRDFLRFYDPHGRMDLEGKLTRSDGDAGGTLFVGVLRPLAIEAAYYYFPYRLRDVNGAVRFTPDGVRLDPLTGRHGPARVHIGGRVTDTDPWTGFDVFFGGEGVPLDTMLYQSLPAEYRALWRRFDPRGLVRAFVQVRRPDSDREHGSKPSTTDVRFEMVDAAICFDQFPYPLEHVRGRLHVANGMIRIDGLTGRSVSTQPAGDAPTTQPGIVRVDGYYIDPAHAPADYTGSGGLELRLDARNLALDDRVLAALPADARIAFEQLSPTGWVDLLGRVFTDGSSSALRYDVAVDVRGAGLCYKELPYPIRDMSGRVLITPEKLTLVDLRGVHGPTQVTAHGDVRQTPNGYVSDITIGFRDLRLDAEIERALTPELHELWRMFNPSGSIHLTTTLHRITEGSQTSYQHRSDVELNGASASYAGFPLRLTDLRGDLRLTDRNIALGHVTGRCGTGTVAVTGSMTVGTGGSNGALQLNATGLAFDDALATAMPNEMRDTWRSLSPKGRFDLDLRSLHFETDAAGRTRFNWSGDARLHDTALAMGVAARSVSGTVRGEGSAGPEGVSYSGDATLARAMIGVFDLRNLTFKSVIPKGSDRLLLQNCSAELFGGNASGECAISLGRRGSDFELSMSIRDVELQEYLRAAQKNSPAARNARGLMFGKLFLRGDSARPDQLRGGGELFIREAQVWRLPLVFEIFRILNLSPDENMFHDGWLKFYIEGRTVHLTKIDLQGGAIALVGSGTLGYDNDELNVRLLAGSPQRLRVPIVTELVEGATRDLFELHVTGTLSQPKIETRPLSNLRRALEAIFPDKQDEPGRRP